MCVCVCVCVCVCYSNAKDFGQITGISGRLANNNKLLFYGKVGASHEF